MCLLAWISIIQWKFIVKTPLRKLFAKGMLDSDQLTTILAEIEAQLNSRCKRLVISLIVGSR